MNGVTKTTHSAPRKTAGTGYVILNNIQPRANYINNCYKNQLVNIITNTDEVIPNCLVAKHVWNYLSFPADTNSRGSCVVWINMPYSERVVVIGVLNKRDELLEHETENLIKFVRRLQDCSISFTGDGVRGVFNIITHGTEKEQSELNIKLINKAQQALLDLYVQGNVSFDVEQDADFRIGNKINIVVRDEANPQKSATISYQLGEGFVLQDEFGNKVTTKNGGIYLEVNAMDKVYAVLNGATGQPAVLGDNLQGMLQENNVLLKTLINTLDAATQGSGPVLKSTISPIIPALKLNLKNLQMQINSIKAQNFNIT